MLGQMNLSPENGALSVAKLIDDINEGITLYEASEFEDAAEKFRVATNFWKLDEALITYIDQLNKSNSPIDVRLIYSLMDPDGYGDFVRALSHFGLLDEILEVLSISERVLKRNILTVALLERYFNNFGEDKFLEALIYFRAKGVEVLSNLKETLAFERMIPRSISEKRNFVANLLENHFELFKATKGENNEKIFLPLDIDFLENKDWIDNLSLPEWERDIRTFADISQTKNLSLGVAHLMESEVGWNLKAKWLIISLSWNLATETDINYISEVSAKMMEIKIKSAYKFTITLAWKIYSLGYKNKALEIVETYKSKYAEAEADLSTMMKYNANPRSFAANIKLVRSLNFENLAEIESFLAIIKSLDRQNLYPRYFLEYFVQNYPSLYSEEYFSNLKNSVNEEALETAMDYYFEMQVCTDTKNLDRFKTLLQEVITRKLLDERHLVQGIRLATAVSDEIFLDYILEQIPEEWAGDTYIFSERVNFELSRDNFFGIDQLLVERIEKNFLIRDEQIVHLSRNVESKFLERIEVTLDLLVSMGHSIPSKAVTSLCERLALRRRPDVMGRLIEKYRNILGENIVYSELQLLLFHLGNQDYSSSQFVTKSILSATMSPELRFHIDKNFKDPSNPQESEVIEALRFEFAPKRDQKKTTRLASVQVYENHILRSRDIVKEVKRMYDDTCQVCRSPLETPFGRIVEAAHIRGLGSPHFGPDSVGNLLCLCPNHHKLFDASAFFLDSDLRIINSISGETEGSLYVSEEHLLIESCLNYQRSYAVNAAAKKIRNWGPRE